MIDSHCHLNFENLKNDFYNILLRCERNKVSKLLSSNTNPKDFDEHINLIKDYKNIYISYGIHPQELTNETSFSFDDLEKKYNLVFDTLVIDCEGALYYILKDDPTILKNINLIIIENDFILDDHKKWVDDVFRYNGLKRIYNQNGGGRIDFFEVWKKY